MEIRNVLHQGGSGGAPLRVGVVGHVPVDWEGAGWILPLGDTAADGEYVTSKQGKEVDTPSPGRGDGGGGNAGDRSIHPLLSKQCCAIYCNKTNFGHVSGGRAASGGTGFEEAVLAG